MGVERRVVREQDMMSSMGRVFSVSMVGLVILSSTYSYVADRTDTYGTYTIDRRGYKVYSRCYERDAHPRDNCRNYRGGSDYYRGYDDYRNRYDRDGDYYANLRGKVNVGEGRYRIINARDAELTCEFPRGSHLISNIIWERVGDRSYHSRFNGLRDYLGRRMEVEAVGDYGSVLIIRDWDERDTGVYRCVGTRSYDSYRSTYGRKETVYMEVEFNPRSRRYLPRTDYSDYFSDRNYGHYRNGWWRTSAVKASEDSIVDVQNIEGKDDDDEEEKKK